MNEMTLLVNAARTDPILRDAALAVEKRLLEAQRSYETAERAAVMWMERAEAAEAALATTRQALAACDRYINWHESRIVPTEELPDQDAALTIARRALAATDTTEEA